MPNKNGTKIENKPHPDHSAQVPRLRRAIGQLEGVERMINERRYCPDIIQQLRAANSAVKSLEVEILKGHLCECIKNSAKKDGNAEFNKKLNELLELIRS
jgi:CsoR family transcriptional regulator, copper-sensing transcriptional repressor